MTIYLMDYYMNNISETPSSLKFSREIYFNGTSNILIVKPQDLKD